MLIYTDAFYHSPLL